MINDGRAEPAELEIMLGQTVFFAIVKGPAVTITERSLVEARPRSAATA